MKTVLIILVGVIALPVVLLLALSATPVVHVQPLVTALGTATPFTIQASDPHGIRKVAVWVEQNGLRYSAWETNQPARRFLWARGVPEDRKRVV